jgi:hypothetical protein
MMAHNRGFTGAKLPPAALLAALLLAPGCFDAIVGYPCAPGYGPHAGACQPVGGGNDAGPGDARDASGGSGGDAGDGPGGDRPEDEDGAGTGGTGGNAGMDGPDAGDGPDDPSPTDPDAGDAPDGPLPIEDPDAGDPPDGPLPIEDPDAGDPPDGPLPIEDPDAGDPPDGPLPIEDPDAGDEPDGPLPIDAPPPLICVPGITNCSERCVNLVDDPDNCGVCGSPCGSGLCLGSICQQQGVGHVVVIGHDYAVTRAGMNNLIGNSVFLSGEDPVTVLVYEGAATAPAITGTYAAIDQVASARGRRWIRQVVQAADVVARLPGADTFLIMAQHGATDAQLLQQDVDWGATMRTFVNSGRAVVLLDGPSPNNLGTFRMLATALLFNALTRAEVTGQTLTLVAAGDAVAVGVPRTYRAETSSVAFTTLEVVKVVETLAGDAVVIHKTF